MSITFAQIVDLWSHGFKRLLSGGPREEKSKICNICSIIRNYCRIISILLPLNLKKFCVDCILNISLLFSLQTPFSLDLYYRYPRFKSQCGSSINAYAIMI